MSSSDAVRADNLRIINLPTYEWPDQEWFDNYSKQVILPGAPPNPDGSEFKLRDTQAFALHTYATEGGLIGSLPVGDGKTLISLVVPEIAIRFREHKRVLLLIPKNLNDQLRKRDIEWVRKRMPMNYQVTWLAGKSKAKRTQLTMIQRPGLYIMNYSQLSLQDTLEMLERIQPTMVVADEAQNLANSTSGRSKKFWGALKQIAENSPSRPEFVFMSGTLTKKALKDFQRLVVAALGHNAPVPILGNNLMEWDSELASTAPFYSTDAYLEFLRTWAKIDDPDGDYPETIVGVRRAMQRRMHRTPGFVASTKQSCDARLIFHQVKSEPTTSERLQEDMNALLSEGWHPEGYTVPTPMHIFHTAWELQTGFYNYLEWPATENKDLLARSKLHLEATRAWQAETFEWAKHLPLGYDMPMEIAGRIAAGETQGLPPSLVAAWKWKQETFADDLLERVQRHRWHDDWVIRLAVGDAAKLREPVLLWGYHVAVQERAKKLVREGGHRLLTFDEVCDPHGPEGIGVLSATANNAGLNLQRFRQSFYLQPLRQADQWEQSIGRTHRQGQLADSVEAHVYIGMEYGNAVLGAALLDATYVHQIMGTPQKIVISDWDPLPDLPPAGMVYERAGGMSKDVLAAAGEYNEKFSQ